MVQAPRNFLALIGMLAITLTPARLLAVPSHAATTDANAGVAVAILPVAHPNTQPCSVTLYSHLSFNPTGDPRSHATRPHDFAYAPPKDCPGPWARVVLQIDFNVTAGRQFDRTASLWLGGVNLFYGTTQEPSANVAPHWRIERDLTDYASLFRRAGHGHTALNNWVDAKYTGRIHGTAKLLFYPAASGAQPTPAGHVYGLVRAGDGNPVKVANGRAALTRTFTLPRNVARAYLDVIAQSQNTDEQWFMCIDDADVAATRKFSLGPPSSAYALQECGGGNFRAVLVSIDGVPAGLAPVYPWIYTGGVDPYLWRPTPGIQTLNLRPYRVNLTPFAGTLDDGNPHAVAVRVLGAHDWFSLAANLLVYTDPAHSVLAGKVTQNTLAGQLAQLHPAIHRHWQAANGGTLEGDVDTLWHGHYTITGELASAAGKTITQVEQRASYANRQHFGHPNPDTYLQSIRLDTRVSDTTRTTTPSGTWVRTRQLHYPLHLRIHKQLMPNAGFLADLRIDQGWVRHTRSQNGDHPPSWSNLDNHLTGHSLTGFNATGTAITANHGQFGQQSVRFTDSLGSCYANTVHSRSGRLVGSASGQGCANGKNHLAKVAIPDTAQR